MKRLSTLVLLIFLSLTSIAQLSGEYFIGVENQKKKRSFENLQEALNELKFNGLKDDVVFKVGFENIDEPILIQLTNNTANFNITIEPFESNCISVENDALGLMIMNANNVTLRNFEFISRTVSYSPALLVENSQNLTLENCSFNIKDDSYLENSLKQVCAQSENVKFIFTTFNGKEYAMNF